MLKKFILGLSVIGFLASCNGDEIDDLENRLNQVENDLGTNSPIQALVTLTGNDDVEFTEAKRFAFKGAPGEYDYIYDEGDNQYEIGVQRFGDVSGDSGFNLYFDYNSETHEIGNAMIRPYYYDKNWYWISQSIYNYYDGIEKFEVKVSSFDANTGAVAFTIFVKTLESYEDNEYGNVMTFDVSFAGTLPVYLD